MERKDEMRKVLIAALPVVLALAVAPLASAKHVPTLPSIDGAVYTTVDTNQSYTGQCKNGNPAINCNQYGSKTYVYLNGGPTRNHLQPDGVYFYAVLAPSGQANPVDGTAENLSDDYDCYLNREMVISGGEVAGVLTSSDPTCFHNTAVLPQGTGHSFDDPFVQLWPYANTTNPGGVYIMAVCYVGTPATTPTAPIPLPDPTKISPSLCKYDAFKVQFDTALPVCKLISKSGASISVAVQDPGAGLESVDVATTNATWSSPQSLEVGTTDPFYVNATKIDGNSGATLRLVVTDVAGNQLTCDPVYGQPRHTHSTSVRAGARALINGLHADEARLSLLGVAPGLRSAIVAVNGRRFAIVRLTGRRAVRLDLGAAFLSHRKNSITVSAIGARGKLLVRISK